MDLALNNLQRLICHKTQTNQTTNLKFLCLLYTKQIIFFTDKEILRKSGNGGINLKKKRKKGFLTALATAIKKDLRTSIRKYDNELKIL